MVQQMKYFINKANGETGSIRTSDRRRKLIFFYHLVLSFTEFLK